MLILDTKYEILYTAIIMERTVVILKPDSVQRGLIGEIIKVFEKNNLKIVALKLVVLGKELWEDHYKHHRDKPFFRDTVDFMSAGPVICMILQGPDAIFEVRRLVGATNPKEAEEGTIRAMYATSTGRNLIHASDSPETAKAETERFFKDDEIYDWKDLDPEILKDRE